MPATSMLKKVTFSGLKVGNADLSYEELETKEPVAFLKSDNQRPIVENVNLSSVNLLSAFTEV